MNVLKLLFLFLILVEDILAQTEKAVIDIEVNTDKYMYFKVFRDDRFFQIPNSPQPIAIIPVVDHRIRCEMELDRMVMVGVCGVDTMGVMDGKVATVLLVPGETICLSYGLGVLPFLDGSPSPEYDEKIKKGAEKVRQELQWKTPYMPQISGKACVNFKQETEMFMNIALKEYYCDDKETVLWLYHPQVQNFVELLSSEAYIEDEQGRKFSALRAIKPSQFNVFHDTHASLFGGLYAFEPLPMNTRTFTIHTLVCGDVKVTTFPGVVVGRNQ